ncbi:3783_t:CDS:2, partial [Diversispora eburnea]
YCELANMDYGNELINDIATLEDFLIDLLHEHSVLLTVKIWDSYQFLRALRILNGKMRLLQDQGLCDNNGFLIRQTFFWLSWLCGLRGGYTCKLEICKDIEKRKDGCLQLFIHQEKNNQGGAFHRNKYGCTGIRRLPTPPDNLNNKYLQCVNIFQYTVFLCGLFLETTYLRKGIWYKTGPMGEGKLKRMIKEIANNTGINVDNERNITNNSCRRTAIQFLKNNNVPEHDMMTFSGHRSVEGIRSYQKPNEIQDYQAQQIEIRKESDPSTNGSIQLIRIDLQYNWTWLVAKQLSGLQGDYV